MKYPPIVEAHNNLERQKIKVYPCHANRLSGIGGCLRKQYYSRTDWDSAIPHDVGLQRVFSLGNMFETNFFTPLLANMPNMTVLQSQTPLKYKEYQITGHPDYVVLWNDTKFVVDAKSFHPAMFDKMNTWQDFYNSKQHYYRNYIYQLQGYMWLLEIEQGFLWLANKATFQTKIITMELDYDIGNEVLERAKTVNKAVDELKEPDRVTYGKECQGCQFRHLCKPVKPREVTYDLNDPETIATIELWNERKQQASEYKKLDEQVKCICNGVPNGICGRYHITGNKNVNGVWTKKIKEL